MSRQGTVLAGFILMLLLCFVQKAEARTDLFFLAPTAAHTGDEAGVPIVIKGERLQAGSFDVLVDTRYIEPVTETANRVKLSKGPLANATPTFFYMASVMDALYDQDRPYLRTVRMAFAFQQPINTHGAEELGRLFFKWKARPPSGIVQLPVLAGNNSAADLALYRTGGGVAVFADTPVSIAITSPERNKRYDTSPVQLSATASSGSSITWLDPFSIVEPSSADSVVATGSTASLAFSDGIYALFAIALNGALSGAADWTVFGVNEDVIVSILGAIQVQVLESLTSLPVAGASVTYGQAGHILGSCFTGDDGVCVFDGVDAGVYDLIASKETYDPAQEQVTVPKDQTVNVTLRILALVAPSTDVYEYGNLKLCVKEGSSSGTPVADARVMELRGTYSCQTDITGCCSVPRVRKGIKFYWVAYTDSLFSEINQFSLTLDQNTLNLVVNPLMTTGLRLEARDALTLSPASSMEVSVLSSNTVTAFKVTDGAGKAVLSPLSAGRAYTLRVATPAQPGPDGGTWQAWQDIELSYNQIVQGKVLPVLLSFLGEYAGVSSLNGSVPTTSSSYGGLSITIADTSSKALSGTMVRLYKAGYITADFVSNSTGKVEITGLYPGQYTVVVAKAGYEGVTFDLTLAAGQQATRYIQLPQILNPQVTEELLSTNGGNTAQTCPGLVIDVLNPYTGQPVSGVAVEIYTLTNGAIVQSGVTNASGRYQGMGLVASTAYGIRLSATVPASAATGNLTWQEVREFLPISIPSDNVAAYSLYFAQNTTRVEQVSGTGDNPVLVGSAFVLKDGAGMPIANTKFKVEGLGDGSVFDLVTDGLGKASFSHDIPGKYRVKALPAGYQGMVLDITLGLGQKPTYTLTLPAVPTVLRPSYVSCSSGSGVNLQSGVKVQVLNGFTGLSVPNVAVRILNTQNQAIFQGVTDANGLWAQDSLSPQTVSVEISWQTAGGWRETQVKTGLSLKAGYREVLTFYTAPNTTLVSSTAPGGGADTTASILLAVVDLQKRPLANVQVNLMNAAGRILQSAYTDTQGRVSFERLETGSYALSIHAANRLEIVMNDLMIWSGNHFAWQVVLPDLFKPSLGALETFSGSNQLRAVVVNGQTFEPLTGVSIGIKDFKGQAVTGRSLISDTGFFTLEGMDSLGPVYFDLTASNYLPQTHGPLQAGQTPQVQYALYAMTSSAAFTAIANPDGVPSGTVRCMPGGQCIVQSQDLLTVFSYDPVRLELRRQAQTRLASATSKLLAFGLAPLGAIQRQVMSQTPYLALVQTGQGTLSIYQYQAVSGASVSLVTTLTVPGEITDAVLLYNGLAVSSTAGVFFYRLSGSDGRIAPTMVSYVNKSVRSLMKVGPGLYGVSDAGQVVGMDIESLELPVVTGIGELGYASRNASAVSSAGIIADTNSMLHPIRFSGMKTLGQASGASLTSPDTLSSGMSLRLDRQISRLSTLAIGKKAFGFGVSEDRLFTVEITDNVPIQTSVMQLPGEVFDLLPIRQRVNNKWSAGLMLATANGFYVLPLPEQGQETVNLSVDFARLLPDIKQNYRLWTAQGFTDVLNRGVDANGNSQLILNTALPSGVYDLAVVGEDGIARFVYYGTSLFTDASGSLPDMQPVLVLAKANRDRAAVFNPGDDIWLNLNLSVLKQTLCDVHILLDYRLTGDTTTYHFYTTANNGMLGFNSWSGSVNSASPQPLIASWGSFNIQNLYLPLISLPKSGGYGGAGMVSVVFTRPGGHPLVAGDIIGVSVAGFSIRN